MQIVLNQTHHTIGDFEQIFQNLKFLLTAPTTPSNTKSEKTQELHLFPELYLTGYPLQDLVMQSEFIERYYDALNNFNDWLKKLPSNNRTLLVGGLDYDLDKEGLPIYIRNVIYEVRAGSVCRPLYTKCLLPNYDIFDEEKYFTPGSEAAVYKFEGLKIGLLICEDMWFSSTHDIDPVDLLKKKCGGDQLDAVINLSASPFFLGKQKKREERAIEISQLFKAPFFYVNRVGGEDEILFDGQSFATNGEKVLRAEKFKEDLLSLSLENFNFSSQNNEEKEESTSQSNITNSWESLFNADLSFQTTPPQLTPWDDTMCEEAVQALTFGLQEYAQKCGFKKFLVALSGGMDSGLVLYLTSLALQEGQELEAIYMPSKFSSPLSTRLAEELCENLNVPLYHFPIKFLHSAMNQEFSSHCQSPLQGLADENIQSRLRGSILYARSNQTGSMVINTSNKSELAVGYSTLYGDSVGAISLLGDLYKSQVYDLARFLNKTRGGLPTEYIERPPSAELRENQEDAQSLPPYKRLDAMLEGFLSYRLSQKKLHGLGFTEEEVKKVYDLYIKSEYKRNQFCPIIKVKAKSFGFGYRVPITKMLK